MAERCPRCNREMFLGSCTHCEEQDRQLRVNSARAVEASERSAEAAEEAARTQRDLAYAQLDEMEKRRRQDWMNAFATVPRILEQEFSAARASSASALLLLARVEKILHDLAPAS